MDVSLQLLAAGTTTTTPTGTPVEPTLLPSRSAGLDALPVLGALVLCGAIFLFRKNGR